ncbi:MAG: hypothetical protein WC455_28475 [Dehalococcoidia bacterium]|jgi:uncharacterized Zn finger protein
MKILTQDNKIVAVEGYHHADAMRIINKYVCKQCHNELSMEVIDKNIQNYAVYCETHGNVERAGLVTKFRIQQQEYEARLVEIHKSRKPTRTIEESLKILGYTQEE